jgi:class 3 adenylate cyclase
MTVSTWPRVGLNSGQVIAGEVGSKSLGYTTIGEQVGIAQRMESVPHSVGDPTLTVGLSVAPIYAKLESAE